MSDETHPYYSPNRKNSSRMKTATVTGVKKRKNERDRLALSSQRKAARAAGIRLLQLYVTPDQKTEITKYLITRKWKTHSAQAALAGLHKELTPIAVISDEPVAPRDMSTKSTPPGDELGQSTFGF